MVLVSIPITAFPEMPPQATSTYGFTVSGASNLMDANGEKVANVFVATKTGNISKIYVRFGTVTTPQDVDIRVESVDLTTGSPSGNLLAANTNGTILSASVSTSTERSVTLTAAAAVTKGDVFAVVMAPANGANLNIDNVSNWDGSIPMTFPGSQQFTASWAHKTARYWILAEYDDGTQCWQPGAAPFSGFSTHTIGTGTTPDEVALKFTPPVKMQVTGWWAFMNITGDFQAVLYDTDGTTPLLTSGTIDKDVDQNVTSAMRGLFAGTATLQAGSTYYLSIKPTTASSLSIQSVTVSAASLFDAMAANTGSSWYYSARTDAGAWSDTTTRRLLAGILVDQIDDGTGSGTGGNSIPSIGV